MTNTLTESISKTQLRFLDVIDEMVGEQQKSSLAGSKGVYLEGAELFLEQISFLRQIFQSSIQNVERDRNNIQGLAQTVCPPTWRGNVFGANSSDYFQQTYCLIAQKESRQNLIIARASSRIADDSRKVAIWTRRDSTDMRIITVITMLFLPGTFVAVCTPLGEKVSISWY